MNLADWQKVKTIFHNTLDLTAEERAAFLSNACDGDDALRREVEALLVADKQAGDFIVSPAMVEVGVVEDETSLIGRRIGRYEILEEIGRGGMGAVYLAVRSDDEYKKEVAIKLIKRGMDTDAILKRFRMERQILANLEHPNIARLLDGGTTEDGLPYFVMEYVKGKPITKYSDQHELNTAERLKLFRQVCSAVQYSHQNLVVHRDIKPSNIIVTEDGTPKLLDFGIAKLIQTDLYDDATEATTSMLQMMTPEYASPEQIRGHRITTATDVYSLGIVLYELLSGQRPFKTKNRSHQEIAQAILTEEPLKPSAAAFSGQWSVVSENRLEAETRKRQEAETLLDGSNNATNKVYEKRTKSKEQRTKDKGQRTNPKLLRGDLDNIVLKALRKEPLRRYTSVQEFSEDIRRHLKGLPVTARQDTFTYRTSKFVERHKAGVAIALLFVITLLSATVITAWQARAARRERAKAEQRFNDVRKLTNSFLFEFNDSIKDLQGATPAREMMVRKALEYLDILAQENISDSSLQFELATAYSKVGEIQGYPGIANIGDTSGSLKSYRKAIEILETLLKSEPTNSQFKKNLAMNYQAIGVLYEVTGDVEQAFANNQAALTLYENLIIADPTDVTSKMKIAECYKGIGDMVASKGNLETALTNYRKALEMSEAVFNSEPDNKEARIMVMVASDAIGATLGNPNYTNLGDTDGALSAYRKQLYICNQALERDKTSQYFLASQAYTLKVIGEVQFARGEWKDATESYKQALAIQEVLAESDPTNAFSNSRLAYMLSNMGEALTNTNQTAEALKHHQRAIEILEQLSNTDKENGIAFSDLNRAYRRKGDTLVKAKRISEALEFYNKALKSNEDMASQDLNNMDVRLELANNYEKIAKANVILAKNVSTSTNKKIELWREAIRRFGQARDVYMDMQSHNLRTKPISDALNDLTQEISKCDEVLTKML